MNYYGVTFSPREDYIQHHGVKGQKWGIRRYQNQDGTLTPEGRERYGHGSRRDENPSGKVHPVNPKGDNKKSILKNLEDLRDRSMKKGPTKDARRGNGPFGGMDPVSKGVYDKPDGTKDTKRLQKDAKKDAEDMARAKAYYGEGAGNRRKQIRNRISERMKDPDYKAEYEKQLAAQDMSKHQKAANRERHMQDAKNAVARTGRGIKNLILGVGGASMAAVALYSAAKLTGADKKIAEFGKKAVNDIMDKFRGMKKPSVSDYDWHPNESRSNSSNSSYTVPKSSYTVPKSDYTVPKSSFTVPKSGYTTSRGSDSGRETSYADKSAEVRRRMNQIKEEMKKGDWVNSKEGKDTLKALEEIEEKMVKNARERIIRVK